MELNDNNSESSNTEDSLTKSENNVLHAFSKIPLPKTASRLPNSTSLEKIYKDALKVMKKNKTSIQPNFGAKRSHSQTGVNQEEKTSPTLQNWIEPKRFAKNPRNTADQQTSFIDNNRFDILRKFRDSHLENKTQHSTSTKAAVATFSQNSTDLARPTSTISPTTTSTCLPHSTSSAGLAAPTTDQQTTDSHHSTRNGLVSTLTNTVSNAPRNKPPPIYVCDIAFTALIDFIKMTKVNKSEFTIKQSDPKNHTIYALNLTTYEKLLHMCKISLIKHYTYTPKSKKPKNLILKGIKGDFSEKDIENDIKELKLESINIIKIVKINFNKSRPDNFHFLIQLSQNSITSELTKVKSLAFQRVRWEPLRKKQIFQCTNCQRLGHSSSNCALGYRCVKCKDSHGPGECKINKDNTDKSQLYCVNCECNGHPASFRGCPFFKFANDIKKATLTVKQNQRDSKIHKVQNKIDEYTGQNRETHDSRNIHTSANHTNNTYNTPINQFPNAWFSQKDNANYLFSNQQQNNNNIHDMNSLLDNLKNQLFSILNTKFDQIQRNIEIQNIRINQIYHTLDIEDGFD